MLFCLSLRTVGIQFQLRRKWSGEKSYFIRKIPRSHKYRVQLMKAHSQADNGFALEEAPSRERRGAGAAPPQPSPWPSLRPHPSRQTWALPPAGSAGPHHPLRAFRGAFSPELILNCPLHSPPLAPPAQLRPPPSRGWLTCVSELLLEKTTNNIVFCFHILLTF